MNKNLKDHYRLHLIYVCHIRIFVIIQFYRIRFLKGSIDNFFGDYSIFACSHISVLHKNKYKTNVYKKQHLRNIPIIPKLLDLFLLPSHFYTPGSYRHHYQQLISNISPLSRGIISHWVFHPTFLYFLLLSVQFIP